MTIRSTADFAGGRILVSGGTGFIGQRLVARLHALGAEVSVLHRGRRPLPAGCASLVARSWSRDGIAAALEGHAFDGVFNLAAYGVDPSERDPVAMFEVNLTGAQLVLRQAIAGGARFFVQAGSSAEYAAVDMAASLTESSALEMAKLYGASKAAATISLLAEARHSAIPLVVARLFNVYGPGEAPHRLFRMLRTHLLAGERVPLSPGKQIRDFLHVDDAVDGLVALSCAIGDAGRPMALNLCSGSGASVADFARAVAAAMQAPEALLGFGDLSARPDDVMHLVGSTAALQAVTKWRPKYGVESGVAVAVGEMARRGE